MNESFSARPAWLGLLTGATVIILLGGCIAGTPSDRGGHRSTRSVQVPVIQVYEDDYDYYPSYEIYYSRNRREYVYRDRNRWIRNSEPRGVSLVALQASPFVRVDFRDSPERHHATVVRSYPRNWQRPDHKADDQRKDNRDKNDRDNDHDGRNDNRR